MCYDIKATYETQLKRAKQRGDLKAIEEITEKLLPYTDLPLYHASGFSHPELLIYTDEDPYFPKVATWGLVPYWVKDDEGLKKIWNSTLNARGETIFEKPSFKHAAEHQRCIIYVDGFYEHHHFQKNTYPYFISKKDNSPMVLAGLWSKWTNENGSSMNTFSIVTTQGNNLMAKIHNNPKLEGPRMPLILSDELADKWLMPILDEHDKQIIERLITSYPEEELSSHTVAKLRGKEYAGNVEQSSDEVIYDELNTLF
ncbi:SOS response-associated peptidase [Geojedonia litorea]|uniref:Abasic site processing protein n=1 Tax=Geojedonia litorea TaxID=1268269 RepID=A0ABV9N6L5_9FLAO